MSTDPEILLRLLLASVWGAVIGAEREYRGKAAGFRTTILISVGACFFTIMSITIGNSANPDRIASNIVTGLGFLSAGVIFRSDNHVNGITTAATIWAVAAVSMGIGAGYYFAAAWAGLSILLILTALTYLQEKIDFINQYRIVQLTYNNDIDGYKRCLELFENYSIKSKLVGQQKDNGSITLCWEIHGGQKAIIALNEALINEQTFDKIVI